MGTPANRIETSIRVLVADDHPAIRAGVRRVLAADGFTVCAEVGDGDGAVEAAMRERPDLCLIGTGIGGGGVRAVAAISEQVPSSAIVMFADTLNEEELFDALRAGATGYILKDADPARLPFVLRGVLAGEAALPRRLAAWVIDEFRSRDRRRSALLSRQHGAELTVREWQVVEALRDQLSTAAIAERLSVSPVTVRRHVSEIVRKLGVSDRDAAARLIESWGSPQRLRRPYRAV